VSHHDFRKFLATMVQDPSRHARWMNTLAYLEHVGGRKMFQRIPPAYFDSEVLEHAAEEACHAVYLMQQRDKLGSAHAAGFHQNALVGGRLSRRYLDRLELKISRFLRDVLHLKAHKLKYGAYLLISYAIEKRAMQVYSVYDGVLKEQGSPVQIRAIIKDEVGHLAQMERKIQETFSAAHDIQQQVCHIENELYQEWFKALSRVPSDD